MTRILAASQSPDAAPAVEFAGIRAQYQWLKPEIKARIQAVLEHGCFIMGPEVDELEAALSGLAGARHCIAVSSGTDALLAALMAWGVGRGDAVFLPAFNFTAPAEVVLLLGATPVFVDVDPRLFNLDPEDLARRVEAIVRDARLRPCAVIPVDLFGQPADYTAIAEICDRHGLYLLADAAQSFGGRFRGRPVGSLAPVTATSFFPSKPLGGYGDGGALFTDDDSLAEIVRSIRQHGQGASRCNVQRVGLNARLDTLQAAVLLAKLSVFAEEIAARGQLADRYDAALSDLVVVPARAVGATSAWAQYSILLDDRNAVAKALAGEGVPTAVYYTCPLHLQPAYRAFGEGEGMLPVSEGLSRRILSLPMNPYLDDAAVDHVIAATRRSLGRPPS